MASRVNGLPVGMRGPCRVRGVVAFASPELQGLRCCVGGQSSVRHQDPNYKDISRVNRFMSRHSLGPHRHNPKVGIMGQGSDAAVSLAALIATQRAEHGHPGGGVVSGAVRVAGVVSQVAQGRSIAAAETAGGVGGHHRLPVRHTTTTPTGSPANHGGPACAGVASKHEHRRGTDGRAGSGGPSQEMGHCQVSDREGEVGQDRRS